MAYSGHLCFVKSVEVRLQAALLYGRTFPLNTLRVQVDHDQLPYSRNDAPPSPCICDVDRANAAKNSKRGYREALGLQTRVLQMTH